MKDIIHQSQVENIVSQMMEIKDEYFDNSAIKAMKARITARKTSLVESKIGGLPYIPRSEKAPTDVQGRNLRLLAQIDCRDIASLKNFPTEGLLQFFILDDTEYGLSCGKYVRNKGYRVIYRDSVEDHYSEEELAEIYKPLCEDEDSFPVFGEFALVFEMCDDIEPDNEDIAFGVFNEIYEKMGLRLDENTKQALYRRVEDIWYDRLFDEDADCDENHTQCGGYAYFTQEDPREKNSPYNTLLFQLDSMKNESTGDFDVLIGDCGVINFFVNDENLKKRHFEDILYHWDCC